MAATEQQTMPRMRQAALFADLVRLWTEHNPAGSNATGSSRSTSRVVASRA